MIALEAYHMYEIVKARIALKNETKKTKNEGTNKRVKEETVLKPLMMVTTDELVTVRR